MSSFWDDFKDIFKSEAKKAEEKQQKINEALQKEKTLAAQLANLDKVYLNGIKTEEEDLSKNFPEDLGLKQLEYNAPTDEEIAAGAKLQSDYEKETEADKLQSNYEKSLLSLDGQKREADESLQSSYKQLEELFKELKGQTEKDALKRGMARSSIVSEQLSDLSAAHVAAAGQTEAAYTETIGAINSQISAMEREQEQAFERLDLKYAADLDSKIAKLKKERESTIEEYQKYNNAVAEKEAKYDVQREKDIEAYLKQKESDKLKADAELKQHEAKYGYAADKDKNYAARYELAYGFYSALSPDIATSALEASPSMKYYLGLYYDKLMSELKKGANSTQRFF